MLEGGSTFTIRIYLTHCVDIARNRVSFNGIQETQSAHGRPGINLARQWLLAAHMRPFCMEATIGSGTQTQAAYVHPVSATAAAGKTVTFDCADETLQEL